MLVSCESEVPELGFSLERLQPAANATKPQANKTFFIATPRRQGEWVSAGENLDPALGFAEYRHVTSSEYVTQL